MNSLSEIAVQNKQDFWSMLYMYIGKSTKEVLGRRGAEYFRKAVFKMAEANGEAIREAYVEAGIKTNLETLYAGNVYCSGDPRVRKSVLTDGEEIRLFEVYTCPLANLWLDNDAAWLAHIYCEENQLGLVKGFTQGKGQCCLGKHISCHRTNGTRPDNYCRYSVYYRAANCEPEQREESFGNADASKVAYMDQNEALTLKCVQTLYYITNTLEAEFGNEGLCAVSEGLHALVKPVADMMRHYASATLKTDMKQFVEDNLPMHMDTAVDADWQKYQDSKAEAIFKAAFVAPFVKELGL